MLDVGCGVGTWLRVWKDDLGIKDIVGIDGEYVDRKMLQISGENFISRDLKEPFSLDRKFDLVMSLEVGEHLPTNKSSTLVDNLVRHGNMVLFSAALLEQHGTYHINEQLPEFWAKFFTDRDFVAVDIIRDKVWNNDQVEWWYRQNIVLYVHKDIINDYPQLKDRADQTNPECLVRVHPLLWKYRNEEVEQRSHVGSFLVWKLSSIKKKLTGGK